MALIRSFLNTCVDREKEKKVLQPPPSMFSYPLEDGNLLQPVSLGWRQGFRIYCHSDWGSRRR